MFAVEKLSSYITQGVYTVSGPFHPFGGAVDIIVVQQPDGSFKSSPWNVRFGKFQGVLKTKEKVVKICVNGVEANFHMYLSHKGEAYFFKEVNDEEGNSVALSTQSSGYEADDHIDQSQNGKLKQSKSCDLDSDLQSSVTQIDAGSQKIVMTTNSNRSQIFGFMFRRKSVDDGIQEEGNGAGLEGTRSLDRAEIAADLLEVNWSTNLSIDRERRDNSSILSSSSLPIEVYKDFEVSDENYSKNCVLPELIGPSHGDVGNGYESVLGNTNGSDEACSPSGSSLESHKKDVVELSTLEGDVSMVISETLIGNGQFDIGNGRFEEKKIGSMSEITTLHVQNPHSDELEAGQGNMQCDKEQSLDEMNGISSCGVYDKESEALQTQCQSSENLREAVDIPDEQGIKNVKPSHDGCEVSVVHGHTEVLYGNAEKIESESQILLTKENLNDSCLLSDGASCTEIIRENERTSVATETKSICMESTTVGTDINSIATESNSSLVIHQETVVDILTQDKSLDMEQDEGSGDQSPVSFFNSCLSGNSTLERSYTAPEPHYPGATVAQIEDSNEEAESRGIWVSSSPSHSIHQDEEEENHEEENKMNKLHTSIDFVDAPQGFSTDYLPAKLPNSSIAPSESSEEDQFLFSDNEDFTTSGAQHKNSVSPDSIEIKNHPQVTLDDIIELQKSSDINHVSSLSTDKFAQEHSPSAIKPLIEESNTTSSPMSIRRSQKCATDEIEWTTESLPNLRSYIENLEASDALHPLSHSLDSSSENLESRMLRKDISGSFKFSSDSESRTLEEKSTVHDLQFLEGFKDMSTDPAFEISLCKHLLYEGMGFDAASQAFDAEKVDFDKFVSLAAELVKDEKLIVRIGGQYFPWDAAAPVILGMVSLGHEHISEPKGMIAVDRVEKTLEDDASNTNVSGGSWRIWPFTFKKSTSMTSVQSAQDGTKDSDADNASESTGGITGDKSATKVNGAKSKVRSTVPTSEQLDTLNLKAGQNMVTFTFSTAMLGKQQVDARIYLWKWNTRIVISDVDGTITKSDVLGQFMPLVGKDWSQTGVAHLFSAIKENGYQLLFLSARAISQAYLTRQFLLNLKQDGKALPDGPVVISPDGLFPSLFREVIRRAPHEFKIACLNDIKALFPPDCNPFYAGFGNRDTDEFSYLKVGIPKGKIFIINPKGEVAVNRLVDTKSYTSLHALVNGMFPPMSSAEPEEYNTWNYWKIPFPEIDL